MPTNGLTDCLRALVEEWRKRSSNAYRFNIRHPGAADDLKASASGQGYAFDECANQLSDILDALVRDVAAPFV